jgi:hypothetical protein
MSRDRSALNTFGWIPHERDFVPARSINNRLRRELPSEPFSLDTEYEEVMPPSGTIAWKVIR